MNRSCWKDESTSRPVWYLLRVDVVPDHCAKDSASRGADHSAFDLVPASHRTEDRTSACADGGITLHIQHESPGKAREPNWLPAPKGPFFMVLREYWPKAEALDGSWKVPPVMRVTQ